MSQTVTVFPAGRLRLSSPLGHVMTPSHSTAEQTNQLPSSATAPAGTPSPTRDAAHAAGRGASPYFTTDEAAAYLRTTRGTVYNLVWRGMLPRRRGKLLFTRQELDDYLAGKHPAAKPRRSRTTRTTARPVSGS